MGAHLIPLNRSAHPTLVIFNYTLDETHPALSHQVEVVEALSQYFEKIVVLTGSLNWIPTNNSIQVISSNWIPGQSIRNVIKFYNRLLKVLVREHRFVVFSHMTLVQSFLAAPILKLTRNPHFLWYAHKQDSLMLRIVSFASSGVITSTRGSCPIQNKKIFYIGQSIDELRFSREFPVEPPLTKFIHIGRADPSKNLEIIIETIHKLRSNYPDFTLTFIGNPSTREYSDLYQDLQKKWGSAVTEGWLTFKDATPRRHIPLILSENHIFIHAYSGSLDKTLIEATVAGLPVATLNKEYRNDFGSWRSDSANLFFEIMEILAMDLMELKREVERRRNLAIKLHSLEHWIASLTSILISSPPTVP